MNLNNEVGDAHVDEVGIQAAGPPVLNHGIWDDKKIVCKHDKKGGTSVPP